MSKKKLIYFLIIVNLIVYSCKKSSCPVCTTEKEIRAIKINSRLLPNNTLQALTFDEILIVEDRKIIVMNISDTSNTTPLYKYDLPTGKYFHSMQLGRFLILSERTDNYSQSVVDMVTGNIVDLKHEPFSSGDVDISPIDFSILYCVEYIDTLLQMRLSDVNVRTFDGQYEKIVDRTHFPKWSPNGKWFAASKFLFKEDQFTRWENCLFNLDGEKVILTREPYSMSAAVWNNDGSALVYSILGNAGIMLIEINWSGEKPEVTRRVSDFWFDDPYVWSPDNQFLVYVKWYDGDKLDILGNDILITDRNLTLRHPIITHDNVIEIPLLWTEDQGLITCISEWIWPNFIPKQLCQYKIDF